MRKKNNDKRVLIPRNNRPIPPKNQRRRSYNRFNSGRPPRNRSRYAKKNNGMLVFLMIIALIAFVIGAGFGVSLDIEDKSDDANQSSHVKNVTKQMVNNVSSVNSSSSQVKNTQNSISDVHYV